MPNEITEKDAVRIAEFLGFTYDFQYGWQHCELRKSLAREEMASWLSSPEGEVAMMDRLFSTGWDVSFWHARGDRVGCRLEDRSSDDDLIRGFEEAATTRNKAFKLATLEMLDLERHEM